ncbi:MAG TPA: thiamine pyrophosphate-binding protein [Burkholderiales bacterium]|nr:thiamine pyrophosphate-binding protein [Burkholderiales bacterium]
MQLITVAEYLFCRLAELGIKDVIGVPGDFNLDLVELLEHDERFQWIGECNELNASYAADGYAREHGISALVTTYGPGELSAVNGVAGAYAEHVPLIKITGGIALSKQAKNLPLHHTLLNRAYDQSFKIYQQITCAAEILNFDNPGAQIDRLIESCYQQKRPVYLQFPQDLVTHLIAAPQAKLKLITSTTAEQESKITKLIGQINLQLTTAKKVVILVGELVERYHLQALVQQFLQNSSVAYVVSWGAKGAVDESHPQFAGMYAGCFSAQEVQDYVENADCVLALGWLYCEINSGTFSTKLATNKLISLNLDSGAINGEDYTEISFAALVDSLCQSSIKIAPYPRNFDAHYGVKPEQLSSQIEHDNLIYRLSQFLQNDDTLILETGTIAFTGGYYTLPHGCKIMSSVNWFSIGYALGATTGVSLAKNNGRTILVVGDGSLQMTVQALSTQLRYGLKPIILVLNNSGYTIERIFLGENSSYNDIQEWNYLRLPAAFGGEAYTRQVSTDKGLVEALNDTKSHANQLCLIEVVMDKYKQPPALQKLAAIVAKMKK